MTKKYDSIPKDVPPAPEQPSLPDTFELIKLKREFIGSHDPEAVLDTPWSHRVDAPDTTPPASSRFIIPALD